MNVLVFGGNSRLAKRLSVGGPHLLSRGEADVRDMPDVLGAVERHKPDVVVNCAAMTDVDACSRAPDLALSVNALGAANIAMVCRMKDIPLVHVSTDYVFAGNGMKDHNAETYPVNTYGVSKLLGESAVLSLMPTDAIVVRVGWLYGVEYQKSQPMVAAREGGHRLYEDRGKAYIYDNVKGTPTFVGHAAKAVDTAILDRTLYLSNHRQSHVVHASPPEHAVSWYGFLVQDFNILPLREGFYKGKKVAPGVKTTWRPQEGGLTPTEGWATPGYRAGLDAFIEEFNESLAQKAGAGT